MVQTPLALTNQMPLTIAPRQSDAARYSIRSFLTFSGDFLASYQLLTNGSISKQTTQSISGKGRKTTAIRRDH